MFLALNHKIRLLSTTNTVNLHSISVIWLFLWAWALLLLTWLISLGWVGRKLTVLCGQEKVLQLFCIDGHFFRRQPAFELLQSTAKKTIIKDYMHTELGEWSHFFLEINGIYSTAFNIEQLKGSKGSLIYFRGPNMKIICKDG